jgi:hypothetical protein
MHVSRAIEQDRQRRELGYGLGNRGIVENVELPRSDAGGVGIALERLGVHVGGVDRRAFPSHGQRGGVADALARGGDKRDLAFESSGHYGNLREICRERDCPCRACASILSSAAGIVRNW